MSRVSQRALADFARVAENRAAVAKKPYTAKQGRYLAFIYYTNIYGLAPAESDQTLLPVSAPSVHEMIKALERNALIERTPARSRAKRLLGQPEHLPQRT